MINPLECAALVAAITFAIICFVTIIPTSGGQTDLQKHVTYCLANSDSTDCR